MEHVVLRNVTLVDGTGASPRPGVTIMVQDNRIEAIGVDDSMRFPDDALVYHGEGRYALPGFIDAHVHIAYTGAPDLNYRLKDLPSFFAIRATVHAQRALAAGITAIRDAGSTAYTCLALRRAIDSGLVRGPRIRAAGYGLKMTGGHGDSFFSPIVEIEERG
ncbi:MAG: amidohydrolase family protein, partial [bacterium]